MPYYTQNMVRFLREQERLAKLYESNTGEVTKEQRTREKLGDDVSVVSSDKPALDSVISYKSEDDLEKVSENDNSKSMYLSSSNDSGSKCPKEEDIKQSASLLNNCSHKSNQDASKHLSKIKTLETFKFVNNSLNINADKGSITTDKSANVNNNDKIMRVTPSCVDFDAMSGLKKFEEDMKKENKKLNFDTKRLTFLQNMLRLMVERIKNCDSPKSLERLGEKIVVDWNSKLRQIKSNRCTYFKAKQIKNLENTEIVAKTIENYASVVKNENYVKILRHLGKKHPYIVQSWDIFVNHEGTLVIIQEYTPLGDLDAYLRNGNIVNEEFINVWARQLFNAMDYLGDMGVCHRNLKPKYILIYHRNSEIRLTGFYNAIVYWDAVNNDIQAQPCKCFEKRPRDHPDFQAPEVYGNSCKEYYDPIQADMWSVGAILFYALTKTYPFDYKIDNPKIEEEIQAKITTIGGIGEECRQFYSEILTTNVPQRMYFDKVNKHDFFVKIKFGRRTKLSSSNTEQLGKSKKK